MTMSGPHKATVTNLSVYASNRMTNRITAREIDFSNSVGQEVTSAAVAMETLDDGASHPSSRHPSLPLSHSHRCHLSFSFKTLPDGRTQGPRIQKPSGPGREDETRRSNRDADDNVRGPQNPGAGFSS